MLRIYLSLLAVASAAGLAAEPPTALHGRVASIRFEPEKQPLTPEQLAAHLPVKVNDPLTTATVRNTIQGLYSTGRYQNIEVAGLRQPNGVALIIRTTERRFVGGVDVVSQVKRPPSRNELITATALNLGTPFSDIDLQNATRGISDLLRRNGYYDDVRIEPQVSVDPGYEQANLVFTVSAGKRAHYNPPQVTGKPVEEAEDVVDATKWHSWLFGWRPVTQARTITGVQKVRRMYAKKSRLLAEVRITGMHYDPATHRLTPTLYVDAGPKVDITTVGAKVSKGDLRKYVPVFDEGTVDRDLIVEGERNLRDFFQNKGYFDVEVDFEERRKTPDREEIVYTITKGPRQKLTAVAISGNKYFDKNAIRERMFLHSSGLIRLRHGRFSDGFVRRDISAIESLYHSNGFRDVKVTIRRINDYQGKDSNIAALVNITEGPQYMVSKFSVDGIQQIDRNKILPDLVSMPGEPFSETNVALDRDFIIRSYQSAGFPDARFDWTMTPGPGSHQFQVHYNITEGKRRYIRDIFISGNRVTSPRLLKPITTQLQAGQPLSLTRMGQVQRDMYQLGVFDSVNMAVQNPDGDTDQKYVLYHLDEGHRYFLAAGVGAELARIGGSQTSYANPAGATGFSPRGSLEVSRLNMWGLGHSLNFKSNVSTLERRLVLDYSAPRYHNVEGRDILFSTMYDNTRDVRTFTATRYETSAQLSQKLSKATTALFRYSFRRVSVDASTLKIQPELVPQFAVPVRVGMFATSLIQDRRDDPSDAHHGFYNSLDMGLAEKAYLSQRNFGRILARNSSYHMFGNSDFVFARNLEVGWLAPFGYSSTGLSEAQAVPLPERFFGGGSTSNRGFPDNQAGPRDPVTGFPIGGNFLFFHTSELRFPFLGENINGVLFHDMGNIFAAPRDFSFRVSQRSLTDFNYMVHAVGFGIRYRTPVGPIRVDLAYSINPPTFYGFQGTQQELLFGQGSKTVQSVSHFQFFFSIGQMF